MNNTLVINEKYSQYWPLVAIISAILTLVFYISYHLIGDVLLQGYLRLSAFGFFALAVLSLFKLKDGKVEITIELEGKKLVLFYRLRGKIIYEEEIDIKNIEAVEVSEMPNRSIYNDFKKSDRCVRFKRTDSENWIYLNEIHSRVIPLNKDNSEKIVSFVKRQI